MPRGPLWFILSYLGRTVGYFLPVSLVWCLLVLWKLVLREEAAKVRSSSGSLGLMS